jgi:N-acetylglucosaminyldiphosphoundecaprenol N-acetyl-beta-D-mannosaminyltransferase
MAVAGAESPPFRELSDQELQDLVVRLRELDADLLWLGLGAPKQEKLMARLKRLGCPCVMVGVGAAFDYESGAKTEAPAWMQSAGLEWLFRLVSEPGRLWKRYLSTNPRFVARVTLEAAGLGWTRNPLERGLRIAALLALVAAFCMAASEARLGALALAGLAALEASARRQGAAS